MNRYGFSTFIAILLFGIILIFVMEIYRDIEIYRGTRMALKRIVNMATSLSIAKDTREGQIIINIGTAEVNFNKLLISELNLGPDLTFGDNYLLEIESFNCSEIPPRIEASGVVKVAPFLLKNSILNGLKIRIPFNVKSRIQDIGY